MYKQDDTVEEGIEEFVKWFRGYHKI